MKSYLRILAKDIAALVSVQNMLIVLLLLATACGSLDFPLIGPSDDGEDDGNENSTTIEGTWDWLETAQGMGTTIGEPTSVQSPSEVDQRRVQYNNDGTYIWQQFNADGDVLLTDAGTWRVENGDLIYNEATVRAVYQYQIENNQLTLTRLSVDGTEGYWIRERWQRN